MKLVIFTIVLDGFPWITKHLPIFQKTNLDWHWIIIEGSAQNKGSTSWCKPQEPKLRSDDGTAEYLNSIKDERVSVFRTRSLTGWSSKDEMVNFALSQIKEPCILAEIDADEIYKPETLEQIMAVMTELPSLGGIRMRCRYFVGPDLICEGKNCWSDQPYEWDRVWRYEPGMEFVTHEPPKLNRLLGPMMGKDESQRLGIEFDHMAYVTEEQVKYKQDFYGYDGLINQWRALQANKTWPVKLGRFFPFVDGGTMVRKI